jgi:hypothetical protein
VALIQVEITGNGKFAGHKSNLESYSVQEDSTPLSPADSSGGTGTVTITVTEDPSSNGSILLLNDDLVLEDSVKGTTSGRINSVGGRDGVATFSGDSRLGVLNATRYVPAYKGDLDGAVRAILALAEITSGIVVDPAIASLPVAFKGGTYQLWKLLCDLCSAHGLVEISLVSNNVVVRPVRTRIASLDRTSNEEWSVQNAELAQYVEVNYYNYEEVEDDLVYPYGGWNPDVRIISVEAGDTVTINIPVDEVNVSLTELEQPVVQDTVPREYVGPISVYSVSGNDGLPIPAAQWTAQGGALSVAIGEDGQSIDVTVTGANEPEYAPYSIAVASGPGDYYSTLRLIGSGLAFRKETLRVPTGAPAEKTAQEVGPTIDNPWVDTRMDAYSAALRAAGQYASPTQRFTFDATLINRSSDSGSYVYPTFADFNAQFAGDDFGDFDTEWGGQTFDQFRQYMFLQVQDNFENQVFGNVSGARVLFRDAWYRIRTTGITQDGIQGATAERDTVFSDFNERYDGLTFGDWDAIFDGLKFEDYAVIPLKV